MIEAVMRALKQWEKGKPTLEGRRLIINMVVGGWTQYCTHIQGMPKQIEDLLVKVVKEFLWGNTSAPMISMDILWLLF